MGGQFIGDWICGTQYRDVNTGRPLSFCQMFLLSFVGFMLNAALVIIPLLMGFATFIPLLANGNVQTDDTIFEAVIIHLLAFGLWGLVACGLPLVWWLVELCVATNDPHNRTTLDKMMG